MIWGCFSSVGNAALVNYVQLQTPVAFGSKVFDVCHEDDNEEDFQL